MTFEVETQDGLNIIHIDDYTKFHSTLKEIRASITTRILLYFAVKLDHPATKPCGILNYELCK
jgi:hypothetical protein